MRWGNAIAPIADDGEGVRLKAVTNTCHADFRTAMKIALAPAQKTNYQIA